ncbi:hypothetical protein JCM5350_005611 [Sporobolomyces pararoseus]
MPCFFEDSDGEQERDEDQQMDPPEGGNQQQGAADAGDEQVQERMEALNEVLLEIGEKNGLSLEVMESIQEELETVEVESRKPASRLQIIQLIGSFCMLHVFSTFTGQLNEVKKSQIETQRLVQARPQVVASNPVGALKVPTDFNNLLKKLVFLTFFSTIVSAWSRFSTQIEDITLLYRNDNKVLGDFVGVDKVEVWVKPENKHSTLVEIRKEINRWREIIMTKMWEWSGKDDTMANPQRLNLYDLMTHIIGGRGFKITQSLLERGALFRMMVLKGARIKVDKSGRNGDSTGYKNDSNFWILRDRDMKDTIEMSTTKPNPDKWLQKHFKDIYEADLAVDGIRINASMICRAESESADVVQVAKEMEAARVQEAADREDQRARAAQGPARR